MEIEGISLKAFRRYCPKDEKSRIGGIVQNNIEIRLSSKRIYNQSLVPTWNEGKSFAQAADWVPTSRSAAEIDLSVAVRYMEMQSKFVDWFHAMENIKAVFNNELLR